VSGLLIQLPVGAVRNRPELYQVVEKLHFLNQKWANKIGANSAAIDKKMSMVVKCPLGLYFLSAVLGNC
jgi:hypothetical protein